MTFFITMFFCNILIPIIMIVGGTAMYKKTPKKINGYYGYRTTLSKKNLETWTFANKTCGELWIKWGKWLLVTSVIVQLPFMYGSEETIGMMTLIIESVQVAILFWTIHLVQKALRENFDKDGNRR